jgi:hypothetical protein
MFSLVLRTIQSSQSALPSRSGRCLMRRQKLRALLTPSPVPSPAFPIKIVASPRPAVPKRIAFRVPVANDHSTKFRASGRRAGESQTSQ